MKRTAFLLLARARDCPGARPRHRPRGRREAALPRRLRRARRSGRRGPARASGDAEVQRRKRPPEGHDGLEGDAGVLRPGAHVSPSLRLHRSGAVVPPGAPHRRGLRHVLDGPRARRAGARARGDDRGRDRQGAGARAESLGPRARVHRPARPSRSRRRRRPRARNRARTRRTRSRSTRRSPTTPRTPSSGSSAATRRRAAPWGRGQFGQAAVDRVLRDCARALTRASGRAPLPRPLLREHRQARRRRRTTERSMPNRARASRTPSTCTATCCRGWAAGRKRSRSSRRPTRSKRRTRRPRTSGPATTGTISTTSSSSATRTCGWAGSRTPREPFNALSTRPRGCPTAARPRRASPSSIFCGDGPTKQSPSPARSRWKRARRPPASSRRSSRERPCSRWTARTEARAALRLANERLDAARAALGREARYMDWFVAPYVTSSRRRLRSTARIPPTPRPRSAASPPSSRTNPRFDAWGEGLFRLDRIAADARREGRPNARRRHRGEDERDRPGLLAGRGPRAAFRGGRGRDQLSRSGLALTAPRASASSAIRRAAASVVVRPDVGEVVDPRERGADAEDLVGGHAPPTS